MKTDYTMDDFRAEMKKREMKKRGAYGEKSAANVRPAPKPVTTSTRDQEHGNTIVRTVPCGVHPLHSVKVRANGSRSGCPMCEMQIEDLCRSAGRSDHAPRISHDRTRITGCTCGWLTPPGTTDSDDAYSLHAATVLRCSSVFNGVKVFCATMVAQRQSLGEQVTAWLEDAKRSRPGFEIVSIQVAQSSDQAFHCISIIVCYNESLAAPPKGKARRA